VARRLSGRCSGADQDVALQFAGRDSAGLGGAEAGGPGVYTIMPNGMAASLSFAQVDRYSDAFAAYLRETLHLEPGARVAIQIPNWLGKITPNGHLRICRALNLWKRLPKISSHLVRSAA
jgi:acyl-CoA synthetase (AMP-forming)/AMP-acid ligase II